MSKPNPKAIALEGNPFDKAQSQRELLGLLVGAASVSWENPSGAGKFDSSWAEKLVGWADQKMIELNQQGS